MDEGTQAKSSEEESSSLCSPKPLAFTIDFGEGKSVDLQRHKTLVERYKNRHKRGQSLSKIETKPENPTQKKHPSSANLPRKSSFQSDGYFSSDEKSDRSKTVKGNLKRDLSLQLKNVSANKMTQSFPSTILSDIISPEVEIKDISSPELDLVSPLSPERKEELPLSSRKVNFSQQHSSPESATPNELKIIDLEDENFVDGREFDFDRSDTVSDTGTYTLDADNYSEAQKLRMSIDREFKIEQITGIEKTQEYIRSLANFDRYLQINEKEKSHTPDLKLSKAGSKSCINSDVSKTLNHPQSSSDKLLSPILSPTQNLSITETVNPNTDNQLDQTFTRIMIPTEKSKKKNGLDQLIDRGSVISVTSSGVFRSNKEAENKPPRRLSLTKSEIQVEAYVDESIKVEQPSKQFSYKRVVTPKLSANVINVQNISVKSKDMEEGSDGEEVRPELVPHLPPAVGGISGKNSPTKIPSPINTLSRPRSRNSLSSQNIDLSDSSIETESYLKSTQSCINSLQKRLSLDSDQDSDLDNKYGIALNNTAHSLLKQKTSHTRHNSLDGRGIKISNKLEHFQSKNLQGIDQTYVNKFNQCAATQVIQKIQNSPNNSPIRRSSSFSLKNQINLGNKNINIQKEFNYNDFMQRSTSAYVKSGIPQKPSVILDHPKIDRNKFGDTESSSEEDFEKNLSKKKDTSLTNTRYNRAFSLRRGRLDSESSNTSVKCPNTPEIRRKFLPDRGERAISVDRKPARPSDIQSRYMTNITKKVSSPKLNVPKNVPKTLSLTPKQATPKAQVMSRTDSGRFSMRASKGADMPKTTKKESISAKKSGCRSNSSLTSREVDFQNWKRRKSYDPIKAAAEGKRKVIEKKQSIMTQSYNERNHAYECDSSPSHSSSVHRSQVPSLLNNKSFHGTAALEQLISSEEEDDMTLSADEGFSPPTPSPCELSPARMSLRNTCRERIMH
ncbi:hypothetical protein WA026_013650 [Henosepilachna vigintioctopunctata]|uniref:Uncharacterized protein n=1 Tax=Henosepilachna vigintioctopunctata TaxID=420089 RepID=A0AAW1UXE1_9CUCU